MNYKTPTKKSQLEKATDKKLLLPLYYEYCFEDELKSPSMLRWIKICGDTVAFISDVTGETIKLDGGVYCNTRFCPFCSWRKAKKNAYEICCLLGYLKQQNKQLIFLTLTTPNVTAENLSREIDELNLAVKRLFQLKNVAKINKGYVRKLEVTYNEQRDDYNPHVHLLVAVNQTYFKSRDYLTRQKWLELWREAKRDPSIQNVHVTKANIDNLKGIYEIATYSAKHCDLYKSKDIFRVFYNALKGRQLITYNGLFKEGKKLLKVGELAKHDEIIEYVKRTWYKWQKDKHYVQFREEKIQLYDSVDLEVDTT